MKNLVILISLLFLSISMFSQELKPELIKVGDVASTFQIKTLDGETFNTKELKGKVIYLNFFATWCGACMKEIPHVESDIWKSIKNDDFVMLAIAREQKAELIKKFKADKNFTMPMAADETRAIYSLFAPQYIPRNIIINRDGKIIFSGKDYNKEVFGKMVQLIKNELKIKEQ